MRRTLALALLSPLLICLTATKAFAQIYFPPVFYPPFGSPRQYSPPPDPKDSPVEIGGYATVGGTIDQTPPPHSGAVVGSAGIYAQWNRFGLCPGLDLRIQGNQNDLHGYLVGPRVAFQPRGNLRPLRLYAEGLFGKNEISNYAPSYAVFNGPAVDLVGVNRSIVFGLDLHTDSAFGWRVIEFSKGDFTGLPGSHPQTITTGIIIHFP
jgi:hypothetical protein